MNNLLCVPSKPNMLLLVAKETGSFYIAYNIFPNDIFHISNTLAHMRIVM